MSSHNEQLEPTPFEPAPAPKADAQSASPGTPTWVWPTLAGLATLAVLVVFWLPSKVGQRSPDAAGTAAATATETTQDAMLPATRTPVDQPAAADASPWSEAQAARLREEAKSVLQSLLDLQFTLEERGAAQWAADDWATATASAQAGDELYRQRQYVDARDQYAQALQQLEAIESQIPATIDTTIETIRAGLEAGSRQQVTAGIETLTLLAPDHDQLAGLQARAAALEAVAERLATAASAEAEGDLGRAETLLGEAVALDPQHQRAAAELARVSAAYIDLRFNDAMSEGYAALDRGAYDSAREQFRTAAALKPGAGEAGSAIVEVDSAQQASRLSAIKSRGDRLEQGEQWQQAVAAYRSALELDPNILFAREGLQRSQARARLDEQLRQFMEKPERLSDIAVAESADTLLRNARAIEPRGALLTQQIAALENLLQDYNRTIPVTLRSDGETEVIVYKIARLGRFTETQLELRPGSYRVRGSRLGYRDVLHTLDISPQDRSPSLTVSCTERIP